MPVLDTPLFSSLRALPPRLMAMLQRWRATGMAGLLLRVGLALMLAGGTVLVLCALWWYPQLPSLDKVLNYQPQQALQVYTSDKVEIAQFGTERRDYLPIAQIPPLMQHAVVAVEDARFRQHMGIDPIGIARAIVVNLTGSHSQGASTITQQVARTFFLSSRKTLERKVKEAMLALKMEQLLSKDQILELYMNQIYLGHRAYGFGAAAQVYFGKTLDKLSVAEAAMLAGLPQNPGYANPITNFERARKRQLLVLGRMRDTGVITEAQFNAAKAEKLQVRSLSQGRIHAEYVAEMARQTVVERFGLQVYSQGMKVYTSLRAADQRAAYEAVRNGVLAYDRRQPYRGPEGEEDLPPAPADEEQAATLALKDYQDDEDLRPALVTAASPHELVARLASGEQVRLSGEAIRWGQAALSPRAPADLAIRRGAVIRLRRLALKPGAEPVWTLSQWPDVQAALVSLLPDTGRITALVGGFDFGEQQFNHATQGWRQPGSSFKPFLYSAAVENGVMPATVVNDAPISVPGVGDQPAWEPKNSPNVYDGPLTLRQALAKSKNLVSVRLVQFLGVQKALDWVTHFGFDKDKQPSNLTLALGSGSTSPLQLASAYGVFANGGYLLPPVLIERITDAQGKVLFEAPPPPTLADTERVVPERNAFIINSLLQEVTRSGTAARAQEALHRTDLFGKTGTTNDAVDGWFAGFQPSQVAVVWMGYDQPRSLGSGESGGGVSLPIWIDFMRQVLKGKPEASYPVPSGVARIADEWTYLDPPAQGFVTRIGFDDEISAASPASAASQPASGPVLGPTPAAADQASQRPGPMMMK